jgi:Metal binding domain of Ada
MKRVVSAILVSSLLLAILSACGSSTPSPTVAATPAITPTQGIVYEEPVATPTPTIEPTATPTLEPTAPPTLEPTATPTPVPAAPTPTPTPQPVFEQQPATLQVVGSASSNVYHYPSCASAKRIKSPVYFASPSQAIAAGYRPCKICQPPTTP